MWDAYLHCDASDADRELDRLADAPDEALTLAFEAIIAGQFQISRQHVHIITGKLIKSGQLDSHRDQHTWVGEIAYTAEHAAEERDRDIDRTFMPRGELPGTDMMGRTNVDHDYLKHIYGLEKRYGEVIEMFMRGEIP